MRSIPLFILSACAVLASCEGKHDRHRNTGKDSWVKKVVAKDDGPMRQRETAGSFDEIEVSQAISAEIVKSDVEKVVISAPENIIDEVLAEISGGKLHIHYKAGIRVMDSHNVSAKIYAKDFSKLEANSAGTITVKDKFVQDKTEIEISSSSSVSGDLEANKLEISADSSGSFSGKIWAVDLEVEASSAAGIDISGKAKNAEISSSSGSSIEAKEVTVQHLKADASSGASVSVTVSSSIAAEASAGGSVDIYKRGSVNAVTKEESSGGSVTIH